MKHEFIAIASLPYTLLVFSSQKPTPKTIKEYVSPTAKKKAQQVTADIVHAAFWSFFERKLVNLKLVDINNFCSKFAARNHISRPLGHI